VQGHSTLCPYVKKPSEKTFGNRYSRSWRLGVKNTKEDCFPPPSKLFLPLVKNPCFFKEIKIEISAGVKYRVSPGAKGVCPKGNRFILQTNWVKEAVLGL